MQYTIQLFDSSITRFLHFLFPHSPFFTSIFSFLSFVGSSLYVWIAVALILLIWEELRNPGIQKQDKQFAVSFVTSISAVAFIVNIVLKPLFHRNRPFVIFQNFVQPHKICGTDFSFPSGHASTAFAAAVILAQFDKKRKWVYYLLASCISFSRIYLACHFASDVIFGGLLGALFAQLSLRLIKTYNKVSRPVHKK